MTRPLFDELLPYYEALEGRDWKAEVGLVASILEEYRCHSVIDLGCGPGRQVIELARMGFEATGIDLSRPNIRFAKRQIQNNQVSVHFLTGSYYEYHPRERFDAALCLNWSIPVKDHDIRRFLDNVSSLIRDKGLLIFDYERVSEIDWNAVGAPIIESWKTDKGSLVRVSIGGITRNVLGSTDVYLIYPEVTGFEPPNEIARYQPTGLLGRPRIFVDNSFVRFFSPSEIGELARSAGYRKVRNEELTRGKYHRSYAVLRRTA